MIAEWSPNSQHVFDKDARHFARKHLRPIAVDVTSPATLRPGESLQESSQNDNGRTSIIKAVEMKLIAVADILKRWKVWVLLIDENK